MATWRRSLDPLDHLTRYDYDLADRLFKVTDAADGVTPVGTTTALGRVVTITNPSTRRRRRGYDPAGRLASLKDGSATRQRTATTMPAAS